MKHPLVAPLITELLQQVRQKSQRGGGRVSRWRRVQAVKIFLPSHQAKNLDDAALKIVRETILGGVLFATILTMSRRSDFSIANHYRRAVLHPRSIKEAHGGHEWQARNLGILLCRNAISFNSKYNICIKELSSGNNPEWLHAHFTTRAVIFLANACPCRVLKDNAWTRQRF